MMFPVGPLSLSGFLTSPRADHLPGACVPPAFSDSIRGAGPSPRVAVRARAGAFRGPGSLGQCPARVSSFHPVRCVAQAGQGARGGLA